MMTIVMTFFVIMKIIVMTFLHIHSMDMNTYMLFFMIVMKIIFMNKVNESIDPGRCFTWDVGKVNKNLWIVACC